MVGCGPVCPSYVSRFGFLQKRTHKLTSRVDPTNAPPIPKSVMGKPEALKWSTIVFVNVPYDLDQRGIYRSRKESLLK